MDDKVITTSRNRFSFTVLDGDPTHTDNGLDFWGQDFPGIFEPCLINWLDQLLNKENDYLDIGSWVGPTVLYGSKLARRVIGIEPDPIALKYLNKNIELNNIDNVEIKYKALATYDGLIRLRTQGSPGNSMTTTNSGVGTDWIDVQTVTLDSILDDTSFNFGLIKMDIEGAEAQILPFYKDLLASKKIPLALSFHYGFYESPDKDYSNIIDAISVYDRFFDSNYHEISLLDIAKGFGTFLCL